MAMKNYLNNLPGEIKELIRLARDIAVCNSMHAYLVGGFVRDLHLGVKNLDLDIVVEGNGIKFAEDFSCSLKAKLIRHRRFGTATVILEPNLKIDIATARKEFYPQPAQLPVVRNGNLRDDLLRRDFTINAMAISISGENFGKLIDFFGGKVDLANKRIRVLHDLSFIDDPTRILRAIRFEKRYNFAIETETLKNLKNAVRLKMLERVEPQRMRDDLILVLKEEYPVRAIRRLQDLAGLGFISKHLEVLRKTYRLMHSIEKQISWFKASYPKRRQLDTWLIYFMGIIDPLSIKEVKSICSKFAFRKGEEKRIIEYKKINRKFILGLNKDKVKPSKVFALFTPISYETIILIRAKYRGRLRRYIEDFLEIYNDMRIYVSGGDLHGLGIVPGPDYRKIFSKVLNARLNGLVKTKEEELLLINKLINPK